MKRIVAVALLSMGASALLSAAVTLPAPEIDPTSGMNALAMLAGVVMIVRSKRKN